MGLKSRGCKLGAMDFHVFIVLCLVMLSTWCVTTVSAHRDSCNWIGSGLDNQDHHLPSSRVVRPLTFMCLKGQVKWTYPRGGLQINFKPRTTSVKSGSEFKVCIKVDRDFSGARIYQEGHRKLLLLHAGSSDTRPLELVRCFVSVKGVASLYVEAVHVRTHTGERPFECWECGKAFTTNGNMVQHYMTHGDVRPFSCTMCEKRFNQKQQLIRHQKSHTNERSHICPICERGFLQTSDLFRHFRVHLNEKPNECQFCGLYFVEEQDLNYHLEVHVDVPQPYQCLVCNVNFSEKKSLKAHLPLHNGDNTARRYKCGDCGKDFLLRKSLILHLERHPRRAGHLFGCTRCSRLFTKQMDLFMHLRNHIQIPVKLETAATSNSDLVTFHKSNDEIEETEEANVIYEDESVTYEDGEIAYEDSNIAYDEDGSVIYEDSNITYEEDSGVVHKNGHMVYEDSNGAYEDTDSNMVMVENEDNDLSQ